MVGGKRTHCAECDVTPPVLTSGNFSVSLRRGETAKILEITILGGETQLSDGGPTLQVNRRFGRTRNYRSKVSRLTWSPGNPKVTSILDRESPTRRRLHPTLSSVAFGESGPDAVFADFARAQLRLISQKW